MLEVSRKKIFVMISFLITIVLVYWGYHQGNIYPSLKTSSVGLEVFYLVSGCANFLPLYIFFAFLTSNFLSENFHKNKYNNFKNSIVSRTGYKKRFKSEIQLVLVSSFILRVLLSVIILLFIDLFLVNVNISFSGDITRFPFSFFALNSNSAVSLIVFIIYSGIGFSIMSLFMYSLIPFIKNLYVYKVSGVLASIIFVMIPAFIGNIVNNFTGLNSFIRTGFLYIFYSAGLLCPGIEVLNANPPVLVNHVYFFTSCFGFLFLSVILLYIGYKKERKNG